MRGPTGSRTALLAAVLAVALAFAACGGKGDGARDLLDQARTQPDTPIVVPAGKPVVIGLSSPLTGPVAAAGAEERDAVAVAVERWKAAHGDQLLGHDIELRVEDDGCFEPDIAALAATRFLRTEGLAGVIGPSCTAGAETSLPIYAGGGIVAISGTATATTLTTAQPAGGFFFRTAYRNDLEGTLIGLFASAQLESQAAYIIDDGEPYGEDLAIAAAAAMEQRGNVQVTRESIENGATDFSALAERIAQDAPAFVGFAGFNPEATLLYRQLRDAGYTGIFGTGDAAASALNFIEPLGELAEGALFAGCPLSTPESFQDAFGDLHGGDPKDSAFVAQSADAATILLDAVAAVATEEADGSLRIDPAEMRDAVRATILEDGVSGPIAFDENGDRVPRAGDVLADVVNEAVSAGDVEIFVNLGLVPCQVQDGRLVNLLGPGAGEPVLP